MKWLWLLMVGLAPRLGVVWLWFGGTYLKFAYNSVIVVMLGCLLAPITTLSYAWVIHQNKTVSGLYWIAIGLAVALDLTVYGAGAGDRRLQKRYHK